MIQETSGCTWSGSKSQITGALAEKNIWPPPFKLQLGVDKHCHEVVLVQCILHSGAMHYMSPPPSVSESPEHWPDEAPPWEAIY